MDRGKVLTTKLLSQGYQKTKLVASFKKFYRKHHYLVNTYSAAVSILFLMYLLMTSISRPEIPDIRFYLHFLRSGL